MEDEFPSRCGRVDLFGQAREVHFTLIQCIKGLDEIFERVPQAVQLSFGG